MTKMMTFNKHFICGWIPSLLTLKSANCIHLNCLWNEWISSQFDPLHVYQHHVKLVENGKYISFTGYKSMQRLAIVMYVNAMPVLGMTGN